MATEAIPMTFPNYFDSYPNFTSKKGELPTNAFERLVKELGWSKKKGKRERLVFQMSVAAPKSRSYTDDSSSSSSSTPSVTADPTPTAADNLVNRSSLKYFERYENFTLREGEQARNAFKRLAKSEGWTEMRKNIEKGKFQHSVVEELNSRFSTLEHYQDLCAKLFPEEPTPSSITQCKKLLTSKYVNIWDIYEGKYKYFDKFKDFRKYTCNGRTFNRDLAKKLQFNVFLRVLGGR
ncbi:hypothetical protein BGZ46_007965 [Entomortierella lignicola]|nr:hypothetical protein BGZ46_007965 [Entomortierella lignicola]